MQYNKLGRTGVDVSSLCLGTMMFGSQASEADSLSMMSAAFERGLNHWDTANMYGQGASEVVVGKGLKGRRDDVVLATKGRQAMGDGPNSQGASRLHLMRELDASLKRLDTDYVDLYYVHTPDYETPIEETLRALDDMVRSGRVRYIACSNFRAWRLAEALWKSDVHNLERFACVQPLYNIVNRDAEVELLPLCQEHGIGVVSYSPLARGILTGKYQPGEAPPEGSRAARKDARMHQAEWREASLLVAQQLVEYCGKRGVSPSQFSLAWCMANPVISSVIIGPRTMDHLEDNLQCLDITLSADDEAFIDGVVPPGEHSGFGFQDSAYPVTGRPAGQS